MNKDSLRHKHRTLVLNIGDRMGVRDIWTHKSIIIGHEGRKLKGVGKAARQEIEDLLGVRVMLKLWVKVKENWRDSGAALSNFGYTEK